MIINPFLSEDVPYDVSADCSEQATTATQQAMSLFELNARVHAVLQNSMKKAYWVTAELSEVRTASNGHCYVEFVQKDERSGALVAKARGIIWRTNYRLISDHFRRTTGRLLGVGIKVMVEVTVTFHELYGYSLNVLNIDPTYTMGDLAQRRLEIIRQLEEDGVMDLNKELTLPRVVSRVAIISSATAAGYGDFCNQLEQSGLPFTTKLFPAVMQGDRVEESVIAALDDIAAEEEKWDVVVIIRGGGATTDLNGFDSYLLASNVAQFPLPVLTGIGHERDDTIVDLVAHTRLKTPTAVAAFLIEGRQNEQGRLETLQTQLAQLADKRLQDERQRLKDLSSRLTIAAMNDIHAQRHAFNEQAHRFDLASSRYLALQRQQLLRLSARMEVLVQSNVQSERQRLQQMPERLAQAVKERFTAERHRQEMISRSLKLAGPERILAMGFSITMKDGHAVNSAEQLQPGDELTTLFQHGSVKSVVSPSDADNPF